MGLKDLVIDSGARELKQPGRSGRSAAALKDSNCSLGFRLLPSLRNGLEHRQEGLIAMYVSWYGGIVVPSDPTTEVMFCPAGTPQYFTDPQRPMTVTEGILRLVTTETSPVLVTTNFALTYFIVSGD
jgi:acetyl-CoA decarbonylase/synthase complex subunit gamma